MSQSIVSENPVSESAVAESAKVESAVSPGSLAQRLPAALDPYQRYRKTLLSPERVRELSQLRPARAVVAPRRRSERLSCRL